ncbi:hypothetical protein MJC1_04157 [Methylocystis sp. MJC1]|nr:hypothetical protein MJC1_04157 [Methylocystis sp. MJC1]
MELAQRDLSKSGLYLSKAIACVIVTLTIGQGALGS